MGQRTQLLLQIEGRSGARLNKVYHLQLGYRKKLPMAFLHILSSRYFRPEGADIIQAFKAVLKKMDGLNDIDSRDWSIYVFRAYVSSPVHIPVHEAGMVSAKAAEIAHRGCCLRMRKNDAV